MDEFVGTACGHKPVPAFLSQAIWVELTGPSEWFPPRPHLTFGKAYIN